MQSEPHLSPLEQIAAGLATAGAFILAVKRYWRAQKGHAIDRHNAIELHNGRIGALEREMKELASSFHELNGHFGELSDKAKEDALQIEQLQTRMRRTELKHEDFQRVILDEFRALAEKVERAIERR